MISIIVPVYNVEKTIERCVDSIIKQTYSDWELLLIDDGSDDCSAIICNKYVEKDHRIKVFHKENGGVSSARNLGLENAKGEFVTFIDSDDWVKEDYLYNLYSHACIDVDLVISYAENYIGTIVKVESYPSRLVTNLNFDSIFIDNNMHWHTSPWGKLYKKSIIDSNNLKFVLGMQIGEDALFLYSYMLYSERIYFSSDTDYCYNLDIVNSLTKRINPLESELFVYKNINAIIDKLIRVKHIKNIKALENLEWLRASYQLRLLNSLYHYNNIRSFRLTFLKENDWKALERNIRLNSLGGFLMKILFSLKMWKLYDSLRIICKDRVC